MKPGNIDNISITGKIVTYSGGNIVTVSATKDEVPIEGFSIDSEGKYEITGITDATTIVIKAKDSNNKENLKTIPIKINIDNIVPVVNTVDTSKSEGFNIRFSATGHDNESGLKQFNYTITSTQDKTLEGIPVDKRMGTFNQGEEVYINAKKAGNYTIVVTAEDNVENKSESKSQTVETYGVMKHIKMSDGTLKEVCTVDIYGVDVIGYNCSRTDVEWQIFYIDETKDEKEDVTDSQVYLIAKDCMETPTNVEPKLLADETSNYSKAYKFGASDSDTSILGNFMQNLPEANTTSLGNFMGKFLSDYAGVSSSGKANLQATNYMLNQNMWSEYLNVTKAECSFGAPTLPLFQASYNDTCKKGKTLNIKKNIEGYQINIGGGSKYYDGVGNFGDATMQKGIYFNGNSTDPNVCMWIASPGSSQYYNALMKAGPGCSIGFGYFCSKGCGVRPIVLLQSGIKFTENENGTYTIN